MKTLSVKQTIYFCNGNLLFPCVHLGAKIELVPDCKRGHTVYRRVAYPLPNRICRKDNKCCSDFEIEKPRVGAYPTGPVKMETL
jgi:hypothetical protein